MDMYKKQEYELEKIEYQFNMNYSVAMLASNIKAKAIIAYTNTRDTLRMLSSFGVECPIFAITENEVTYRQLGAVWNVTPRLFEKQESIDELIYLAIKSLKEEGFLEQGDNVVIAGGAKTALRLSDDEAQINEAMGGIEREKIAYKLGISEQEK